MCVSIYKHVEEVFFTFRRSFLYFLIIYVLWENKYHCRSRHVSAGVAGVITRPLAEEKNQNVLRNLNEMADSWVI
jgi:hypothetical protein